MKKSKKFLCLLLALVMAGSLLLLPASSPVPNATRPFTSTA